MQDSSQRKMENLKMGEGGGGGGGEGDEMNSLFDSLLAPTNATQQSNNQQH